MKKRPAQKHLFHILILSLAIILAGGGVALLSQLSQKSTSSFASGDYVVGSPSLPASYVDSIFQQLGSPMVGTGKAVEAASRQYHIDDAFALAVWWTETNDGAAGVGLADRNPGSVRGSVGYPSAYDGYTIYPSYTAAVNYWFYMMKKVYIDRGLTTVSSISHPYVGTSTSDLWAGKVIALMQKYRAEAPPPPTPTPTIAPDLKRQGRQLSQDLQQQGSNKSTYYPQATPVAQQGKPAQSGETPGVLSGNTRTLVVFLVLTLAVLLAAWAWLIGRRAARTPQPAPVAAPALSPWEQLRVSGQQPASLFTGFDAVMRTTESLAPGLPAQRTTETLATTLANQANMEMPLAVGAFAGASEQTQFQGQQTQTPRPAWMGQQFSPVGGSAAPDQQTTSAFAMLSSQQSFAPADFAAEQQTFAPAGFATEQQAFPTNTFAFNQQAFPAAGFAAEQQAFPIEQLAFPSEPFSVEQQAFPSFTPGQQATMGFEIFTTGQQAFPSEPFAPDTQSSSAFEALLGGQQATTEALPGGQQAFPVSAQATGEAQTGVFGRPGLSALSLPAQGWPYAPRQQNAGLADDTPPQPVGAGAGGGLLSRYRAQSRQE